MIVHYPLDGDHGPSWPQYWLSVGLWKSPNAESPREAFNHTVSAVHGTNAGKVCTLLMPTLLAKLGPVPGLRVPLPGALTLRAFVLPNISFANASFFLRCRSGKVLAN